ncbi:MAG: tetratricopeptide repeat protein, partial [Candidatus Fonsibacter sp.]
SVLARAEAEALAPKPPAPDAEEFVKVPVVNEEAAARSLGSSTRLRPQSSRRSRVRTSGEQLAAVTELLHHPKIEDLAAKAPLWRGDLTADEAAATAAEVKERWSAHFRKCEYQEARSVYSEAMCLAPLDASLWLNRSIANRHCGFWLEAERDATAVMLQPSNIKAHYSK